jgi:hypothetical protein
MSAAIGHAAVTKGDRAAPDRAAPDRSPAGKVRRPRRGLGGADVARALGAMGCCGREIWESTRVERAEADRIAASARAFAARGTAPTKLIATRNSGGGAVLFVEGPDGWVATRRGDLATVEAFRDWLSDARRRRERNCLECGVAFLSEHAGHRMCGPCRTAVGRGLPGDAA